MTDALATPFNDVRLNRVLSKMWQFFATLTLPNRCWRCAKLTLPNHCTHQPSMRTVKKLSTRWLIALDEPELEYLLVYDRGPVNDRLHTHALVTGVKRTSADEAKALWREISGAKQVRIEFPRTRGVPRYFTDKLVDRYADLEWDYGDMATLYRELAESALVHRPSSLLELSARLTCKPKGGVYPRGVPVPLVSGVRVRGDLLRRALWQLVSKGTARPVPASNCKRRVGGEWLWRLRRQDRRTR